MKNLFKILNNKVLDIKYNIIEFKNNLIKKLYINICKDKLLTKVPEWTGYDGYESINKINYGRFEPIKTIYMAIEETYKIDTRIHAISYQNNICKINIEITTERPGLIIGKCGKDIDMLKMKLSQYFENVVEIDLIEI